jgi:beta-lactamase regulating signal transducer with metallopeptidase domain
MKVAGQDCLITTDQLALVALAGFIRSTLVVSDAVVAALSRDELDAAIRHECAHGASRDNLKRLLALLAPDPVPFVRPFSALDRGWTMFSEWAADDAAVAGDACRSLSLAAALVRVARLSAGRQPALASALIPEQRCVAARVERLLSSAPACAASARRGRLALAVSVVCAAAVLFAPAMLKSAHAVLEHLVR